MMSNTQTTNFDGLRNGQVIKRRLNWLEDRLYWIGELNRADLTRRFGISPQQASADIAMYQSLAPPNIDYDRSRKLYKKGEKFAPLFEKDLAEWLRGNGDEEPGLRAIKMVSIDPGRRGITPRSVQILSSAYHLKTPLSILYHSRKDDEPTKRIICPHTIVETNLRWHVRSWDANRRQFVDLIPSRIVEASVTSDAEWVSEDSDTAWNSLTEIVLVPSSRFSEKQRHAVQLDYGMVDGRIVLEVREALVYYQLSAMHLVEAIRAHEGDPKDHNIGIAVGNWRDLRRFVSENVDGLK